MASAEVCGLGRNLRWLAQHRRVQVAAQQRVEHGKRLLLGPVEGRIERTGLERGEDGHDTFDVGVTYFVS